MSDQLYRIRPLVWEKRNGEWIAKTTLGDLAAWLYHDQQAGKFYFTVWEYASRHGSNIGKGFVDLEAAQLAAETWHRERLAADLEVVTTD